MPELKKNHEYKAEEFTLYDMLKLRRYEDYGGKPIWYLGLDLNNMQRVGKRHSKELERLYQEQHA